MHSVWEKLRKFLGITPRHMAAKRPLPDLKACQQQLSQGGLELEEVRKKLIQRAESLERLAQRYNEHADKHNKLKHRDLAEAAVRQKLKDQVELKQWQQRVKELAQRLKMLKARQVRWEERGLHLGVAELTSFRESIERTREGIYQIYLQLEIPTELEDGEVSTFQ